MKCKRMFGLRVLARPEFSPRFRPASTRRLSVTLLAYARTVPNDSPEEATPRTAIQAELERLEESCMYSSQGQFEQTEQWRTVNWGLGVPASVLAAVAGATALAATTGRIVAGILAICAAGFGAILTTINASDHVNQAAAVANAYLEIQTAVRQCREIDLPYMEIDDARQALAELTARRDEQNKTAEPPNRLARRRAKKNIEAGGQTYAVDEGKG